MPRVRLFNTIYYLRKSYAKLMLNSQKKQSFLFFHKVKQHCVE